MENQAVVAGVEKKKVSREEFEKKVEIEAAHLMYFDGMYKEKAFRVAREDIGKRFELA